MARTLVDTSVWIEFYHPRGNVNVKRALRAALQSDEVAIVAPIILEMLSGAKDQKTYDLLRQDLSGLDILTLGWQESAAASQLGWTVARAGQRIPTIDLLIAGAAKVHRCEVWHFGDKHFVLAASAGGVRQRDLKARATRG